MLLLLAVDKEGTTSMLDTTGHDSTVDDITAESSDLPLAASSEQLSSSTSITSVLRQVAEEVRVVGHDPEIPEETCEQLVDVELCDRATDEMATGAVLGGRLLTTIGFVLEIVKQLKLAAAVD